MASTHEALERLCAPEHEVSAHYLIDEEGAVFGLVPEAMRAWHAGAGAWGQVTDVNSRSIGIELANPGNRPFAAPQMATLEELLTAVQERWQIPPVRVIGHSDMAPGRKSDPGPLFDWQALAAAGLAVMPPPGLSDDLAPLEDTAPLIRALQTFGMTAPAAPSALIEAFRQRFRPLATGPACAADLAIADWLAAHAPVDRIGPAG